MIRKLVKLQKNNYHNHGKYITIQEFNKFT